MSRRDAAEERWAVAVANGMRPADIDTWLEALVGPDHGRRCERCRSRIRRQTHRA